MVKKALCLVAALMLSVSTLSYVGCDSGVDNSSETPEDAKFNPSDKPSDESSATPPDDAPPPPPS